MAGKPGGILGLGLAIVLVGAIAATPFYLGFLRSEDQAFSAAAANDSDTIRRAVANLDHELALLNYMFHSGDDPDALDDQVGFRFAQAHPNLWNANVMRDMNKLVDELTALEMKDAERDTTVLGRGTVHRGRPFGEAVAKEAVQPMKSGEDIVRRADAAMNQVRSVTVGNSTAANSLDVNRVRSLYLLAKARIEMDKARFERSQASLLRTGAEQRATSLSRVQGVVAALDAKKPDEIIQKKQDELSRLNAGAAQAAQAISGLRTLIDSRKSTLASLQDTAAEARKELSDLAAQGSQAIQSNRYAELSDKARSAEAEAAAIQNGTLKGASVVEQDGDEPAPPAYEGGTAEPGLDQLEFRLAQLTEQEKALTSMRESLQKDIADLTESSGKLTEQSEQISGELASEVDRLREQLASAEERSANASKFEDNALKLLKDASAAAKSASAAAKKRASDAMQAAGAGENVDERLQRVSQDFEMEAYVQSLVGHVAYVSAMVRFERIQALVAVQKMNAYIAKLTGSNSDSGSNAEELESLKTDATNEVAEAIKSFEQVATLINRVNLRFPNNTTISGKNYAWEALVGQAACHLLSAALQADDRDASFASQSKAYDLLKQAVEKREQSPLLASAMDALIYLQKNAR